MIQNLFTASQIAHALGMKRQAVRRVLANVPPGGQVIVFGVPADAWTVCALPALLQELLAAQAKRLGYQSPEQLLRAPAKRWESAVPLSEVAQHCLEKAVKLQRALAGILRLRDDPTTAAADRERGLDDYRKEFGHAVSARHLHRLVARTLDRDGGAGAFGRLDLYLDDNLARKYATKGRPLSANSDFRELQDVINDFPNPDAPTPGEKEFLWRRSFELLEELTAAGRKPKKVKNSLLKALWRCAPFLAASHNALRMAFNRKPDQWMESPRDFAALVNGRKGNSRFHRAAEFDTEDIKKIRLEAGEHCHGRVLQAARQLLASNSIHDKNLVSWGLKGCDPDANIYRRLLDVAGPAARTVEKYARDKHADRKTRPSMDMDYDLVPSMQRVSVDDFTFEVRFRVPDGLGWWRLTRGQVILCSDDSTWCALGFGIQPEEAPNSLIARTTLTRVFQKHGVPDNLTIERGKVFADSALVTGGEKGRRHLRDTEGAFSDAEVSLGLRQFCKVHVSMRPQSKPIERVGDLVQALMSGEPGWTGKEERYDCPHETKHWSLELKRQNPEALTHFYTLEEWKARLEVILFDTYNNKRHGKGARRIPGLSPLEAFERKWDHKNPPRHIPPELRFLLSHAKIENVTVTNNGARFTLRGKTYRYFDEQTGYWQTFIDKPLTAWFDPEEPQFCTFTDGQMRNAFTVPLHTGCVPDRFDEAFEGEMKKAYAHVGVGKRLYAELKAQPWATFRRPVVSTPETIELGQHISAERSRLAAAQSQEQRRQGKVRKRAGELGIRAGLVENSERSQSALDLMAEARRDHAREEMETGKDNP